jgi:opacity protein-like surface antigen
MKTLPLIMILALAASASPAQPREGRNKELSLSGSLQSYSSGSSSGSSSAFLISPRLGFFVVEGLELEPEALLMLASGSDPVYVVNANVSYNFVASKKGVPFLLLGYGRANTVPFFNVPIRQTGFGVGVVNVGAGVKIYLIQDIALRIEYRFQRFYGEGEPTTFGDYSFTEKVDTRIHMVQFGFSVLL